MYKQLCFVILNYKQAENTINNVKMVSRDYPGCSCLVLDNNSRDGSFERMEEECKQIPNVKIYSNNMNTGYAKGNNLAVKKAIENFAPEFIAIMNPDVILNDVNLVPKSLNALKKYHDLAICTGLMLDEKMDLNYSTVAWRIPDKLDDVILNIPVISTYFNPVRYKKFNIHRDSISFVEVVPGSFFLVRTKYFEAIGMFDEGTFLYCEERILGIKVKQSGYKTGLIMDAFFLHNHPLGKPRLSSSLATYRRLFNSRWYFNLQYNTWPEIFVLPFLLFSGLVGFPLILIKHIIMFIVK